MESFVADRDFGFYSESEFDPGAKVCGPPAYDRQFGKTDFFVLARTADIVDRFTPRFP